MSKKKLKTFIFMFMASVLGKGLALVRTMMFANYFGTGDSATASFTASNITLQFLEIFMLSVIGSSFIPAYAKIEEEKGRNKALLFSNNFMNIVVIISMVIAVLGVVFAPEIVKLIAPGLNNNVHLLAVDLVRIMFPSIIFGAMAYVCVAFLQSNFEFNIPNLISALFNMVVITYLLIFGSKYGVYGVSVAMLLGWLCQLLIQIPSVIKHKYKFKFSINFKDMDILNIFKSAMPIMLVSLFTPIINMINMSVASRIDNGYAISAIEYSHYIYISVAAIFAYAVSNLIFPTLSKLIIRKSMDEFKKIISKVLDFILLYSIPISTIVIVCGREIIKLLYERGEFTSYSTMLTSNALIIYCLAIMAFGINEIMNKCYYAMSKTKIPFITGLISVIINIVLSFTLAKYLGVSGIALAYVIATFINSILLMTIFNRKIKIINSYLVKQLFKNIISAIVMGISLYYLNPLLLGDANGILFQIILLVIDVLFGLVIYVVMNLILRNTMVINIVKMMIDKIKGIFNDLTCPNK